MDLAEELYCTMIAFECFAKKKAPITLAETMINIARSSLEDWRTDSTSMTRFTTDMFAKDDLRYKL